MLNRKTHPKVVDNSKRTARSAELRRPTAPGLAVRDAVARPGHGEAVLLNLVLGAVIVSVEVVLAGFAEKRE